MTQENQKHKTVGVSFNPQLRERANERARNLGLSFSRYVTMCVESELNGRPPQLLFELGTPPIPRDDDNLQSAIDAGSEYGAAKAASIDFEDDIEEILRNEGMDYQRYCSIGNLRTDFLVKYFDVQTDREVKIALECKHNLRGRYTVSLGQAIVLRSLPQVDVVVLCVPYLKNFDNQVRETFALQDLPIAIPDNVVDIIRHRARMIIAAENPDD